MFLDSTLLIDLLRGKENAIQFLARHEAKPLFTSEINVFELVEGAYSGNEELTSHLDQIFGLLATINVLPFDRKAAIKAGEISARLAKKGIKIGETDCLIAAVAVSNGVLDIVTENKDHFSRILELKVVSYT